jgi:DNA-binding transcriptional LysR family regulator
MGLPVPKLKQAGCLVEPFELKMKTAFSFYAVTHKSRLNDPMIKAFVDWITFEAMGVINRQVRGPAV